jgi:hypothetical protein
MYAIDIYYKQNRFAQNNLHAMLTPTFKPKKHTRYKDGCARDSTLFALAFLAKAARLP